MKRDNILLIISVIILLFLCVTVIYGCSCFQIEKFNDGTDNNGIKSTIKINGKEQEQEDEEEQVNNTEVQVSESNNESESKSDSKYDLQSSETQKTDKSPNQTTNSNLLQQEASLPIKNTSKPSNNTQFTEKEMHLFNAVIKDQITNKHMQELIKSGVLNENLVEKYLNNLDDLVNPVNSDFTSLRNANVKNTVETFDCKQSPSSLKTDFNCLKGNSYDNGIGVDIDGFSGNTIGLFAKF